MGKFFLVVVKLNNFYLWDLNLEKVILRFESLYKCLKCIWEENVDEFIWRSILYYVYKVYLIWRDY